MTGRELRLRKRIDRLTDERDQALVQLGRAERRLSAAGKATRRCVYCGWPTQHALACHAHSDLIALDPYYQFSTGRPAHATGRQRASQEVAS